MRSQEEIIKRVYAPLNLSYNLEVMTPNSPVTQIFNEATNQTEPTREVTPCVIRPSINAWANDGSWDTMSSNEFLTEMKWLVAGTGKNNWVDISTLTDWQSSDPANPKYEIDETQSSYRGAISIYKDLPANTKLSLKFVSKLYDPRLNANYDIETDEIVLSTINKGEDSYSIGIAEDTHIKYNPLFDKLLLFDYMTSHGKDTSQLGTRVNCYNGSQYERTIPVDVFKGKKKAPEDSYSLQLWRVGAGINLTPGANELISISKTQIVLDLRLIEKQDYLIKLIVSGKVIATKSFVVYREYSEFICRPMNGTTISYGDTMRYHKALVHDGNGNKVECPENILQMVWHTEANDSSIVGSPKTVKTWNEGDEALFPIAETGLGENDYDLMRVYFEYDQKPAYEYATDEKNNLLTNEKGEYLIIN